MNKVILMGRLTKDAELKVTPNGINVCDFSIAVDRRFVKPGEQRQADFINCRAWRNTAEFISKWFPKGKMIVVVGSIQSRSWDDADGKKRYATDVIIDEAYFAGDKGSGQSEFGGYTPAGGYTPSSIPSPAANNAGNSNPFPSNEINDFIPIDSEDDLPF